MSYILVCNFGQIQTQLQSQNLEDLVCEFSWFIEHDIGLLEKMEHKNINLESLYNNYVVYKFGTTPYTKQKYIIDKLTYDRKMNTFVKQTISNNVENIKVFEVACDKIIGANEREQQKPPRIPSAKLFSSDDLHSAQNDKSDDDSHGHSDYYVNSSSDESKHVPTDDGSDLSSSDSDSEILDDNTQSVEIREFKKKIREIRKMKQSHKNEIRNRRKKINKEKEEVASQYCEISAKKAVEKLQKEKSENSKKKFEVDKVVYYKFKTAIENGEVTKDTIPPFYAKSFIVFEMMDNNATINDENSFDIFMEEYKKLVSNDAEMKCEDDPYGIFN